MKQENNLTPTSTPTETSGEPVPQKAAFDKPATSWLAMIALGVALLSLAGAAYLAYAFKMQQAQTVPHIADLQTALAQSHRGLSAQKDELEKTQLTLNNWIQSQKKQTDTTSLQVGALIDLADFHLALEKNVSMALQLLERANQKANVSQDPGLIPLKTALTEDIALLKSAPQLDVPAVLTRLNAFSLEIQGLSQVNASVTPAALTASAQTQASTTLTQPTASGFWEEIKLFAQSVVHGLSNIVIVSKKDAPNIHLLTSDQYQFVKMDMQAQIDLAEWAVIHRETQIYQDSLSRIRHHLSTYFSQTDPAIQTMLTSLAQLMAISVNPPVPNISHSLGAMSL